MDADPPAQGVKIARRMTYQQSHYPYAATSAGSPSAKPRRYSAALEALLHAVKNARLSAFNNSIHVAM